jgi:hypothetical protein
VFCFELKTGCDTNSYGIDTNWCSDTRATDHITSNLDKLSVKDKYNGGDQVHTTLGACMNIMHIGHSNIRTHDHDIILKNILHVPQAQKNLVSVHRLTSDNDAFMKFHPWVFLIKDRASRKVLLSGRCKDVWGPTRTSVGSLNYYVSFIDDYDKYTWIYLLKDRFEVSQKFHEFQSLVEQMLGRKIIAMKTDWRGEYQRLNAFFQCIGISHNVSCPHAHQQNGAA